MARPALPRPTDAELAILRALWEHGPLTVRQLHQHVKGKYAGYTSTLKLVQIMCDKKLLEREESRPAIYRPSEPAAKTRRHLILDLVNRAFDASASSLIIHALATRKLTNSERDEIRKRLDELEREQ